MMTDLIFYTPSAFIQSALMTGSLSSSLHDHKLDIFRKVPDLSALVI